jgi:lipid-A-disaccharide synthase
MKSGTGTLEAALEGIPFVVAYKANPVTFSLAKRLVKLEHISLANLVAGEEIVPELLQDEATAGSLAAALDPLLRESSERAEMVQKLAHLRTLLGEAGAAERVAALAVDILVERGYRSSTGGEVR